MYKTHIKSANMQIHGNMYVLHDDTHTHIYIYICTHIVDNSIHTYAIIIRNNVYSIYIYIYIYTGKNLSPLGLISSFHKDWMSLVVIFSSRAPFIHIHIHSIIQYENFFCFQSQRKRKWGHSQCFTRNVHDL